VSNRVLMKGNEAVCRGAVAAGCKAFFGYPITPQNEIPEIMSWLMPENGGVFVQAESELAAINMVYGASCTGARAMTSSSSPGVSLKQEGISYMVGCELPGVIVNVQRGGPGLGNIAPSQSDYFQAVKGGGHGDYHCLTVAPWSVEECFELTALAFELADKYRTPAMVLMDGMLGQMLEPVPVDKKVETRAYPKPWATTGAKGRAPNIINSLYMVAEEMEEVNLRIQARYAQAEIEDVRCAEYRTDDADLVLVAYGTVARICRTAVDLAREDGYAVGMLRPISLYPFPKAVLHQLALDGKLFLAVEMSCGQMVEDVRLSVCGVSEVHFFGRTGGVVPDQVQILEHIRGILPRRVGGRLERAEVAKQTPSPPGMGRGLG